MILFLRNFKMDFKTKFKLTNLDNLFVVTIRLFISFKLLLLSRAKFLAVENFSF